MWLLAALAVFLGLSYVGRQVRLGKWKSGPWFRQFRTVRSFIALAFLVLGVVMLTRGLVWEGIASILAAVVLGGTVRFSTSFSTGPGAYGQRRPPGMAAAYTAEEVQAYRTLGLAVGADRKTIKEAWKRLMREAHPDQGGSAERAKALNAARDVLLKRVP